MNHVMIDLETLGTKPDSVFLSVAAVQFNILTGETGTVFYANVSLDSAIKAGRKIEPSTLQWWLTQNPAIMAKMFDRPSLLQNVLQDLSDFFETNCLTHPWGNSASFDLGILSHAFHQLDYRQPWSFKYERCYRTMIQLLNEFETKDIARAHDPVYDCKYQITNLVKLNRELNFKIR